MVSNKKVVELKVLYYEKLLMVSEMNQATNQKVTKVKVSNGKRII